MLKYNANENSIIYKNLWVPFALINFILLEQIYNLWTKILLENI